MAILTYPLYSNPYNSPMEYIIDPEGDTKITIKIGNVLYGDQFFVGDFYKKPNETNIGIDIQPYINNDILYNVDINQTTNREAFNFSNERYITILDSNNNVIDTDILTFNIQSLKYEDWLDFKTGNTFGISKEEYLFDDATDFRYLNDFIDLYSNKKINKSLIDAPTFIQLYNSSTINYDDFFINWVGYDCNNNKLEETKQSFILNSGTTYNIKLPNIYNKLEYEDYFTNLLSNEIDFGTGFNNNVYVIKQDNLGRFVIGGSYTQFSGTSCSSIIRLNLDGTIDTSFNVNMGGVVYDIHIEDDNKIVAVGVFSTVNSLSVPSIIRLNTDGTTDTSFNPVELTSSISQINKITLFGSYYLLGGTAVLGDSSVRFYVINKSDGTVPVLTIPVFNGIVNSVEVYNNKIYIGGSFTDVDSNLYNRMIRLNSDFTIDTSFIIGDGFGNTVFDINIYNDKILVSGQFIYYDNVVVRNIVRLNLDGSIDTSFNFDGFSNGLVFKTYINNDIIYIVGNFSQVNSIDISYGIYTLNLDGSHNTTFEFGNGFNNSVRDVIVINNNNVILVGNFTSFNTEIYNHIISILSDPEIKTTFLFTDTNYLKGEAYQLYWKNRRGGMDFIPLIGKNYIKNNFEKYKYEKNKRSFINGSFKGDILTDTQPQYLSTNEKEYELNSDIIGNEYKNLEDIFDSDLVYLYSDIDKKIRIVEVIDTNFEHKNFNNFKIFNFKIKVKDKIKNIR